MSRLKLFGTMLMALVLVLTAGACAQPATTADNGSLKLYVTDAPPDAGVTGIMVTVSEVKVHKAGDEGQDAEQAVSSNQTEPPEPVGGEWITIDLADDAKTFDLLDIAGVEQYLGNSEIEAAKYTQVRLAIEKVQVEFDNSGEYKDARVPSGTLRIAHPFSIIAGQTTGMVIDFDADKMVTVTGNGDVIVKPVVKIKTRQERGPGEKPQLEDNVWKLRSLGTADNQTDAIGGVTVRFDTAEGNVNGKAGCNNYFGSYQVDGDSLTVGMLGNTEMFCGEPEGLMDQEQEYLKELQASETYEINGNTLTITAGDYILKFTAE